MIGTLAREAAEQEHEVFIVSGDKDMMQLVTPQVKILNPQKDNLILDPAKVTETLGVPPEKVVDVMALRGDAVDNIPGAPGIGDKGSVELIRGVRQRGGGARPRRRGQAQELSRVAGAESRRRAAVEGAGHHRQPRAAGAGSGAMETQPPDLEACRELFTELEFTSMLRELAPADGGPRSS